MREFAYSGNYSGKMDGECIKICNYLNSLPTCETISSCCGHGLAPFSIFFKCTDIYSMSFLGQCIDRGYFKFGDDIIIKVSNSDIFYEAILFELETFSVGIKAYKTIDALCDNMLLHINHENYIKEFIPNLAKFILE